MNNFSIENLKKIAIELLQHTHQTKKGLSFDSPSSLVFLVVLPHRIDSCL